MCCEHYISIVKLLKYNVFTLGYMMIDERMMTDNFSL